MSVRQAVPAVIALDAGLDHAAVVGGRQAVLVVARMTGEVHERRRIGRTRLRGASVQARDRVADERAERVLVHAVISTASMMPMMAASTAAAFLPSASPAALPSITSSTFSPTPAPTESIASSAGPFGCSSSVSGCTRSSLAPSSFLFFCVATTVPTTRAICISALSVVPVIDDSDHRGVGGRLGGIEREGGLAAADEEDALAGTGADRIERHECPAGRVARGRDRLEHEQLHPRQIRVLHRRNDFAEYAR